MMSLVLFVFPFICHFHWHLPTVGRQRDRSDVNRCVDISAPTPLKGSRPAREIFLLIRWKRNQRVYLSASAESFHMEGSRGENQPASAAATAGSLRCLTSLTSPCQSLSLRLENCIIRSVFSGFADEISGSAATFWPRQGCFCSVCLSGSVTASLRIRASSLAEWYRRKQDFR